MSVRLSVSVMDGLFVAAQCASSSSSSRTVTKALNTTSAAQCTEILKPSEA